MINALIALMNVKWLRQMLATQKELAQKLEEHEQRIAQHDGEIATIFEAIRQLMALPEARRKKIGFKVG